MPGQPPRPLLVQEIEPAGSKTARAVRQRFAPAAPFPARRPKQRPGQPPFQRDELQLSEMARRHLAYEIKMVRETAQALQGKGIGPRSFRNAMLETFLIHYRNLLDFFYADHRRSLSHDVRAQEFVADPRRWKARRPKLDQEASSNRERVNAQLAHLTYRRLKYEERQWSDRRMLRQLEELIQVFVEQLPPHRRRWFLRTMNRAPRRDVAA